MSAEVHSLFTVCTEYFLVKEINHLFPDNGRLFHFLLPDTTGLRQNMLNCIKIFLANDRRMRIFIPNPVLWIFLMLLDTLINSGTHSAVNRVSQIDRVFKNGIYRGLCPAFSNLIAMSGTIFTLAKFRMDSACFF